MDDLESRLEEVCIELERTVKEFNEATQCCFYALQGINQRLGRIESWIKKQSKDETKILI